MSFPRTRRLLKKSEFDDVFAQAKKIVTPGLVIFYRDNVLGQSRLGLALSKKIFPKAHDRNYLKRRLRETFRKALLPPIDIVVVGRANRVKHTITSLQLGKIWESLVAQYK